MAAEKVALPDFLLKTWDSDDGLPAASINDIARTPEGYLWIATGTGLARFDGVRFVIFTTNNTPALGDNRMACLTVDAAGNLWVGTEAGTLARRHEGVFTAVTLSPEIRGKPLNSLVADGTGAIWLATAGAGLERWRDGVCSHFDERSGLPARGVAQVAVTGSGQLFAIAGGKLAGFDGNRWQTQAVPAAPGSSLAALAKSSAGGIWVATTYQRPTQGSGGQVLKFQAGQWTELPAYPWPYATMAPKRAALLEDEAGVVWLGTYNAGLLYWEAGQKWQQLTAEGGARQITVKCLAGDKAGTVWAGYGRSDELQEIRRRPVKTMHLPPPANQSRVFTVCAARDQNIWVGTSDAGVYCWRDGKFAHYGEEQGLDKRVGVIFEDRHTNLWVGTWGGLFQLKGRRFEPAEGPAALRSWVQSLCEDHAGCLWAGTSEGLVSLDASGARVFGRRQGLAGSYLKAIAEDRNGGLWVGIVDSGLFRRVGERFEQYGRGQWAGETEIRALHADASGDLWIATWGDGLYRLRAGKFEHWSTAEGLPSQMLHAIIEDASGNLWFSSDNGFFGCPKRNFDGFDPGQSPPLLFWRLSTGDGLDSKMGSGAGQPTAARSADGRLWFPNQYALAVFDPAALPVARPIQTVQIEEVLVDDAPLAAGTAGALCVKSGANQFEFHYTSPTLQAPERLRFRYRLEGVDSEWVNAGARRVADYNHLPPGRYAFRVMAGGADGLWHESAQPLAMQVIPRFWERWWFRLVAAALGIGGIAMTARLAERAKLRRRLQELETQRALEKERRRIAQDLHDDIGARLTGINLQGELAGRAAVPADELRQHLAGMNGKVREVISAMDEIVWAINPRHDSVSSLASYLQHFSGEFFELSPIHCRTDIQAGLAQVPLGAQVRHNLFLAVKEAYNNVAKHSGAAEIWLTLRCTEQALSITVEDDGRGFDPTQADGRRNGMANMQTRLQAGGGECLVDSQPGRGCRVRFVQPL